MEIIYPEQRIQTTAAWDPDEIFEGRLMGEFEEDWDIRVEIWPKGEFPHLPIRTLLVPEEWEFIPDA